MKTTLAILFYLACTTGIAQTKAEYPTDRKDSIARQSKTNTSYKPEILNSGFIDIVNNGQINASARFIRLFIGEPGKFAIPLSIYSGVSSNNFQNQTPSGQRSNDQLINGFINPLSGLINISVDGIVFFRKKKKLTGYTRAGWIYHAGLRVLTGYKAGSTVSYSTVRPINFLSSFYTTGLYFQTGAWERNNAKNIGIFWLTSRYIFSKSNGRQLQEIIPSLITNGQYHGWSLAGGVEINGLVNIKVIYYKYIKGPEMDFTTPIYQFSFNYSLRN